MSELTGQTILTDPHLSKIDPNDPKLRLPKVQARRLRRGPIVILVATGAALVVLALSLAVTPSRSRQGGPDEPVEEATPAAIVIPEQIQNAPENLAIRPTDSDAVVVVPDGGTAPTDGARPRHAVVGPREAEGASPLLGPDPVVAEQRRLERQQFFEARSASILVQTFTQGDEGQPTQGRALPPPALAGRSANAEEGRAPSGRPGDQNMQDEKVAFLDGSGRRDATAVASPMQAPRSPYEVKAGTVIPIVLLTGINSDLPGEVVGQVRENVYDTLTGNHLLIPQGSRVLATYDPKVAYGHNRVLICWNRLIRPDGSSLNLECSPGVDLAGRAGFADTVNHHWGRLVAGVVLSSLLGAGAAASQGSPTGYNPSFPQLWAAQAGQQVNQAGQQIVGKNLQIQPTIEIRPGYSVNVFVNKDLELQPWRL